MDLEEVEKKIKIPDDLVKKECEKLRNERPEVAAKPLNDCLTYARAKLKAEESESQVQRVMERIKEGITIKHNDKFDLDEYLKGNSKKPASPEGEGDKKESKEETPK